MNREKTAEFLADCLAQMPDQPEHVQRVVDTVIAGLKRIADGGEWTEDEAREAAGAAWAAADAAKWAARAADWAARAHPDPDAERERQKAVRKELGV